MSGNRIGVLNTAGNLYAKEGNLYAQWVLQYTGVKAFDLSGNRIGVVNTAGDLYAKKGNLYSQWIIQWGQQSGSIQSFS